MKPAKFAVQPFSFGSTAAICAAILFILAPVVAACAHAQDPRSADNNYRNIQFERIRSIVQAKGSARVIVQLRVPNYDALAAASQRAKSRSSVAEADKKLSAAIAAAQQAEVEKLAGVPHKITRTFGTVPHIAMSVSKRALAILEKSKGVIGINEDSLSFPSSVQ